MAEKVPQPRWRLPKDTPLALSLLFPVAFIMGLVIIYPLGRGFYISLLNWRLTNPAGPFFSGLGNYLILAKDSIFFEALWNTVVFSGLSVIGGFVLGMILALLLNANIRFTRFFRGIALAPWIVPYIVVAFLFQLLFNFDVGVVNYALRALGIAEGNLPWLALPRLAMAAVIIANIWNQTPFYMLMLLA
ncbi:MAG: sugar ABC transporter permease, partial [Chloroflexi bacterium]|nr:sugar ABC transporter permease [Chloroflexota bacterium]